MRNKTVQLKQGFGIDTQTFRAIVAEANEILDDCLPPGEFLNLKLKADRAIRDDAASRLVGDLEVGKHFECSFSSLTYPQAHEFFQSAAVKFVVVANNERMDDRCDTSSSTDGNDGDLDDPDADYIESSSEEDIGVTIDRDEKRELKRLSSPNDSAFTKRHKSSGQFYRPRSCENRESEVERNSAHEIEKSTPPLTESGQQGVGRDVQAANKGSLPNTLEITSLKSGYSAPVCLSELFATEDETPKPNNISLSPIQVRCNTLRKRRKLADLPDDKVWFKFIWRAEGVQRDMEVFDNGSLRYAYGLWLGLEDISIPFVLSVDEEDLAS